MLSHASKLWHGLFQLIRPTLIMKDPPYANYTSAKPIRPAGCIIAGINAMAPSWSNGALSFYRAGWAWPTWPNLALATTVYVVVNRHLNTLKRSSNLFLIVVHVTWLSLFATQSYVRPEIIYILSLVRLLKAGNHLRTSCT